MKISALYSLRERDKAHSIVHRELDGLESIAHASPHGRRRILRARGSDAQKRGKRILERIYGQQISRLLRRLDDLYPGLAHKITQDAYGLIMNRVGLTLPQRELANVVVLYAHGFDRQLYSHLRGAIRVGISKKTLKTVILVTAKTIGKRSKQTLDTIEKIRIA
ncbi:MAG: carboxymuconolactone decarboxylase family protein [Ignavibacteriales bacterium]|nr:carboxymuconolactone decarboxylase family protein [Ignavibacteriales bacterium]